MTQILKLSESEVKITMINKLKTLVEKVNKTHEQMENFIRVKLIARNEKHGNR